MKCMAGDYHWCRKEATGKGNWNKIINIVRASEATPGSAGHHCTPSLLGVKQKWTVMIRVIVQSIKVLDWDSALAAYEISQTFCKSCQL